VELKRRLQASVGREDEWPALAPLVESLLGDALLRRLLEAVVVPNRFVERLVTVARAGLLRDATRALAAEPALPLASIVAMAHQCFNTEYVHEKSPAETTAIAALSDAIVSRRGAGEPVPPHVYAIYACYRPLHTLDNSAAIAEELLPTALSSLAVRQIREPQEESRLRGTIPALTEVAGAVSTAVRDQYEENPYPRWLRIERDVAQDVGRGIFAQPVPACEPRRPFGGAAAHSDRWLRHGKTSDRHRTPVSRFQRARDRSEPREPRLREAQDAGARHRQHRVPAGGPPGDGRASRELRRRRQHRRSAPSSRIRSRDGRFCARCCDPAV
jgi:hypothetical protein